jgi:hypothetical protein
LAASTAETTVQTVFEVAELAMRLSSPMLPLVGLVIAPPPPTASFPAGQAAVAVAV